jgi:hypothetical protein
VSIVPGLSTFTRIFRSFRSSVHVRANERTAALAGKPFTLAIEAFMMIEPRR